MWDLSAIHPAWRWPIFAIQGLALFYAASTLFDAVHYTLHRFLKSRSGLLRRVGGLHQAHHDFFTASLRFDERYARANLIWHVIPEYSNQVLFTAAGLLVLRPEPVAIAWAIETVVLILVICRRGMDEHHIAVLDPADRRYRPGGWLVSADYHSLHHVHPDRYYSSYVTVFDRLMGTACQIAGHRVALTGGSGAFGSAMARLLEREGATVEPLKHGVDFVADDASAADDVLRRAEILVLCHGAKGEHAMEANCDSFVALIERFRAISPPRLRPIEVWAVGSEIEAHPAFGDPALREYRRSKCAYARHARRYYADRRLIYRHIVPSAFRSAMGPGLISGEAAARAALFLIRRGFRYVPVTYTGIALVNFFKFAWFTRPAPPPPGDGPSRGPGERPGRKGRPVITS